MSMYVVVLSDIELGPIESLRTGTTLSGTPTGAPSIPAALTSTLRPKLLLPPSHGVTKMNRAAVSDKIGPVA
jgi:hypothetical protein